MQGHEIQCCFGWRLANEWSYSPFVRMVTGDTTFAKAGTVPVFPGSDKPFRTLFEKAVDAIAVSRDGFHVFVNPAYVELYRYDTVDDLIGRPVLEVVAPSSRHQVAERIELRAQGIEVPTRYE